MTLGKSFEIGLRKWHKFSVHDVSGTMRPTSRPCLFQCDTGLQEHDVVYVALKTSWTAANVSTILLCKHDLTHARLIWAPLALATSACAVRICRSAVSSRVFRSPGVHKQALRRQTFFPLRCLHVSGPRVSVSCYSSELIDSLLFRQSR